MKKIYTKPEIEKILLERTDIITGSDDGRLTNTNLSHDENDYNL